jgi:hypothetical protein
MRLRSSLLFVGWSMLASVGDGRVSVMQSAQSAAVASSTSEWQAGMACILTTSPGGAQEVVRHVRDEHKKSASALLPREGQPDQQLGPQLCVGTAGEEK